MLRFKGVFCTDLVTNTLHRNCMKFAPKRGGRPTPSTPPFLRPWSCQFDIFFAKQTPTLLSWLICLSINLMLIITLLKTNTKTLSPPILSVRRDDAGAESGNGLKRNRRQLQLLREDSCVIKVYAIYAKYADIFEKHIHID